MNKFVTEEYLPALRSGKFLKIKHSLFVDGAVCVLGVAGRCLGMGEKRLKNGKTRTYQEIQRKLGLKDFWDVVNLNDTKDLSFPEIADYLETHPELFREDSND
jgi:hypothetical protein